MKWNKFDEVKPTEEKPYLCALYYEPIGYSYYVYEWSNDELDWLGNRINRGAGGFYDFDSKYGISKAYCDYWTPIESVDDDEKSRCN